MEEKPFLGIFDSGVGGFSVLKEVRKVTDANSLYFGDCAHAPYGNKQEVEIVEYIKNILLFLKERGVTHFVSACNSMSVLTTQKLLKEIGIKDDKYIDMVDAIYEIPFENDAYVLIIGTKATIASGIYQDILREKKVSFDIFCPATLAGDIEAGDTVAIINAIAQIITYAEEKKVTNILYACTHYPLVNNFFIEETKKRNLTLLFIDPAKYVASLVRNWSLTGERKLYYETSKETEIFEKYKRLTS